MYKNVDINYTAEPTGCTHSKQNSVVKMMVFIIVNLVSTLISGTDKTAACIKFFEKNIVA